MRAEIRCCCDPGLLLGYVELDRRYIYEGQRINFDLRPFASLKPAYLQKDGDLFDFTPRERITLQVAMVHGHDKRSGEVLCGLAIKSEDTPIEQLRRIRGFEEAK